MSTDKIEAPRGNAAGFVKYLKQDILSGFLVFLIALPLCLGISLACGYPPIAGIFTAIIGGILTTFISNSELTIKGPAAGLIGIAIGAITEFGGDGLAGGWVAADQNAYRIVLGIGVAAGIIQILFGLFRTGIFGEFFPTSAVHGMLAAIGITIIVKQIPVAFGTIFDESHQGSGGHGMLGLLLEVPSYIMHMNPAIALIGVVSLLILFCHPLIKSRFIAAIPAPMIVLVVAVPMGMMFQLDQAHEYVFNGMSFPLSPDHLVPLSGKIFGMFDYLQTPDFSGLAEYRGWKWVIMFALIGSLESMLSAKAIELLDPWKRKTNMDRDMVAVGIGNTLCAFVGGLPMISEIVRSKANIDNGARTRFADMFHAVFLLAFVALLPGLIHQIPLAALGAMLVYTGFRLASPREFVHVYKIGSEQLIIFVTTIIAVLATDLLIGIAIGIATKFVIHTLNGAPLKSLFRMDIEIEHPDKNTCAITVHQSAVFSNWISFKRQIESEGLLQRNNVLLDFSDTKLVDHSVMEKLHEMEMDFKEEGLRFEVRGLDTHQQYSRHEFAARKRGLVKIRRITVIATSALVEHLAEQFTKMGATGYTITECQGVGREQVGQESTSRERQVRIEILAVPEQADTLIDYLRREVIPVFDVTASVETVEVIRPDHFRSQDDESKPVPQSH